MKKRANRGAVERRRHGRVRRWLVRPFFWGLAALAMVFFLVTSYLESEDFERRFGVFVVSWLEGRLERSVEVGNLMLSLYPLAVEAREMTIGGEREGSQPFATAERVLIEATFGSLLSPGVALNRVLVERPVIVVTFDEEGRHDAPRWNRKRRRSSGGATLVTEIGLLEVAEGSMEVGHDRYPVDFVARGVKADLIGGGGIEVRGQAVAQECTVRLPGATPYSGKVEVDATFRRGRIDVRQARVSGPDLDATASGIWQWGEIRDTDLRLVAESRFEMLQRLGYLRDFGVGRVRFEGNLRRRPGEWFLDGAFSSPAADILGRRLRALEGEVFGDQQGLRIEIASGSYGEGSVTGSVVMSLAAQGERPVDLELKLSDISLPRLLLDQGIPLQQAAAVVSGNLDYRFPRSRPRRGNGTADLRVTAVEGGEDSGLPLSGSAPLSITDGVLRSSAIRLGSESQRFLADGSYDLVSGSGQFQISALSDRVEELFPMFGLAEDEPDIWQPLAGSGTITGEVVIEAGSAATSLRVDLGAIQARGYSAERLQGSFRVLADGVDELRLELSRPSAAMIVAGEVYFEGNESSSPQLSISLDSAGWPLEDFRPWLPVDPGLDGRFTGGVTVTGELEALQGSVSGRLESVEWGTVRAEGLDLDLEFDPSRLRLNEARLNLAGGIVRGAGEMQLEDESVSLEISSGALDVSALPVLGDLAGELNGSIALTATVAGTLEEPLVVGSALADGLRVGDLAEEAAETSRVDFRWQDAKLQVEGELRPLLALEGGGRLSADAVDLAIEVQTDRLGEIVVAAAGAIARGFEGEAAGVLNVQGEIGQDSRPAVLLRLDEMSVEREQVRLINLEPVVIGFESDGVRIESLFLGDGREAEAFAAGSIRRGEPATIDLDVQASLDAEWFQPLLPGIDLRGGVFEAIGSVGGSVDDPRLNGLGELRNGRVLVEGLPSSVDAIESLMLFYPRRVVIERASAEVAGGSVQAGGTLDLDGSEGVAYRFQLSGHDLSVRYPEDWLLHGDTELTLASTASGRQISGIVRLDSARYVEDVQLLKSLFGRQRVEEGDIEPWRNETQLDLVVELADGLEVRNNIADIGGSAELVVRGSLARPVIFGEVGLRTGGRLIYSGQEYTVERGFLHFTNPYRIEPALDLVATTDLREYDITLTLSGTPERLQAEFVSNPPLAELEVLALLTGGGSPRSRSFDQPADGEGTSAAETFLYGQATSLIAGRFNRLFGLDQLRIDPLTGSSGDLSSARITVGKQLSRDLFATYSYDPSETEEQILELEWSVSRSLVLVLTQNGDGTYAVDARWEKAI